ncbi:30S ribosomal protein S1 [candidate division WOR-3 bacterium]|nr:30S ribosomal protein S1 [candidate division WOR-3 bacterium]
MKDITREDLNNLLEGSMVTLKEGDIVKATIIKKTQNGILLNLGLKAEGFLPLEEFTDLEDVEEGKIVHVYLEAYENREGFPVISKKKADFQLAWDRIKHIYENGETASCTIKKRIKGGYSVDLMGVEAFMPSSQIEYKSQSDSETLIGQKADVKIVKINMMRKNIVVSRKMALEEEQAKARKRIFSKMKVGDIIEGTVRNLTDFGAFIDIGGIDALLHITDISWFKITHPAEVVKPGDKIQVKVLIMDRDTGRIAVGLKQLSMHPWEAIENKYPVGTRVKGRVTSVVDYGAFVELEKGIEGLIHISEMSWTKDVKDPSSLLKAGDITESVVLSIDRNEQRISLGMKQTKPDPWSTVDEKLTVGEKVVVKVTNLKDFGAFVQIIDGVEGLIHVNDFFWDKKVKKASDYLRKGQKVEAVICSVDRKNRRISLSIKHCKEDPFTKFAETHSEGSKVTGKISDILPKGIRLVLEGGVEEFIPANYLARRGKKPKDLYTLGEDIEATVRKVNTRLRRVILSEKEVHKAPPKKKEVPKPTPDKFTIGDILDSQKQAEPRD